ncbi:MAG: hypothetical protein KAR56_00105 [Thermoplasmata archaeon]|nr:hypothetical protein [Thermoplasmata archaeon]
MSRKLLAVLFGLLLMLSAIMGVYSALNYPQPEAFTPDELHSPGQYISPDLEPLPTIAGDFMRSPNISVFISIGNIYVDYGSSIRIQVQNNDSLDIFLEEVVFEWTSSGAKSNILVHQYIDSNQSYDIEALGISGPSMPGNHKYQLSMRVLIHRNSGWYHSIVGGDEWLEFSEHTIEVLELTEVHDYDMEYNYRIYYERVNQLVDFNSENVASAAENATADFGTEYNIGKVCAIFNYLDDNCVYTEDPGGDKWYSPDELLNSLEGDCEDYAMLIAAMVNEVGGTSRIYLTNDHAFATVYVGNSSIEFEAASDDINSYYGTIMETHAMVDETGYWMIADPLGTFYMGGFAVGQSPINRYNGSWNTTFEESDTLHAIDVTGIDLGVPLWQEPNVWMGMILIFCFMTVIMALGIAGDKSSTKTRCHICAEIIGQDLYVCPECKTTFHRHCAFEHAYCMTCQNPIILPPPPESLRP